MCEIHNSPQNGSFQAKMSPKIITVFLIIIFSPPMTLRFTFLSLKLCDKVSYRLHFTPMWREMHNFNKKRYGFYTYTYSDYEQGKWGYQGSSSSSKIADFGVVSESFKAQNDSDYEQGKWDCPKVALAA